MADFTLEDYTQHLIDFVRFIGEDCHIVAVCQPTVSALAATAVMARDRNGVQPASLTLMAGPIDARVSPTKVNELAQEKPIEWFRSNMIGTVPAKFEGRGRRVYPGFLQLCAFMSMNAERHSKSFIDLFHHRVAGDIEKADAIRDFYKEYFAIMDMSADFYLETVDQVFQRYLLPLGKMQHKGEPIDLRAIKKTFLLTVEGERDDICAAGQTLAAQDLCSGLRPYMKTHHLQAGVGHYGVFNGKRWEGASLSRAAQPHPVEPVGLQRFLILRRSASFAAGRLEECVQFAALKLSDAVNPVGCPGANLIRGPLIRRTVGFAAGSSSSKRGSRFEQPGSAMSAIGDVTHFETLTAAPSRASRARAFPPPCQRSACRKCPPSPH